MAAESTTREAKLIQYLNEAYGKEKELENRLRRPFEAMVLGQDTDSIHRLRVRGDDSLGFVRRAGGVPAREDLDGVLQAGAIALDRR